MEVIPCSLGDLSDAKTTFGKCGLQSNPHHEALIVAFEGVAGNSHEHCGTFALMDAMIAAGVAAWDPDAIVLDLRKLTYDWGDEMHQTLAMAGELPSRSLPVAVVVSDLNREGLTSLVSQEMQESTSDWLFESIDEAILAVDRKGITWLTWPSPDAAEDASDEV